MWMMGTLVQVGGASDFCTYDSISAHLGMTDGMSVWRFLLLSVWFWHHWHYKWTYGTAEDRLAAARACPRSHPLSSSVPCFHGNWSCL
jgi:hypothetical protein